MMSFFGLRCMIVTSCAGPESFGSGSPTFITFFYLVDEGRENTNATISGPSSAR